MFSANDTVKQKYQPLHSFFYHVNDEMFLACDGLHENSVVDLVNYYIDLKYFFRSQASHLFLNFVSPLRSQDLRLHYVELFMKYKENKHMSQLLLLTHLLTKVRIGFPVWEIQRISLFCVTRLILEILNQACRI